LEAVGINDNSAKRSQGGFLCHLPEHSSEVRIFGFSFKFPFSHHKRSSFTSYGVPLEYITRFLKLTQSCFEEFDESFEKQLMKLRKIEIPTLEIELNELSIASVRKSIPVPPSLIQKLERCNPRRTILIVAKVKNRGCSDKLVEEGDLILSMNKTPVTTVAEYERILYSREKNIRFQVFRTNRIEKFDVPKKMSKSDGPDRIICWNGMVLWFFFFFLL